MLFDHKERFDKDKHYDERIHGKGPYVIPQHSTLSSKGTKIVDSYVQRSLDTGSQSDTPGPIYSPNEEISKPRVICPKWSDTERFPHLVLPESAHIMSYDIKGDFDKIPPNSQSPVKFFGSGDRHLKFVSESAGPHPSHPLSADNSVFEQPSFSDYIYVREDDDEGSYLSVESADRSYRAITGNSSSCKIGEKLHYPPPDNVHFPGPGRYDVRNPKPTQLGITIKSRTKHPQANPPQQVPGPNSYNTSTSFSLVPKSFNVRAVASMRAAEDVYTFPKKPPLSSCPSNHKESVRARKVSNASAGSRRERNIVDASSFLAEKAAAAGGGGGGAALSTPKEPLLSTANSVGSMSQAGAPCRRRRPPKAAVPEGPPVQVSKEEVKSARNFFGDILKTTGGIIQRVDTEDHSSTK